MKQNEHQLQRAVFEWAEWMRGQYPELEDMWATPNGGHRNKAAAGKMKAEGQKKGIPDIFLAAMRGGYGGCFIEVKIPGGRVRPEQAERIERLVAAGYYAVALRSFDDITDTLVTYLKGGFVRPSTNGERSSSHILTDCVKS